MKIKSPLPVNVEECVTKEGNVRRLKLTASAWILGLLLLSMAGTASPSSFLVDMAGAVLSDPTKHEFVNVELSPPCSLGDRPLIAKIRAHISKYV